MTQAPNPSALYRLLGADDWRAAQADGLVPFNADDRRDGFMHLSTGGQVLETARRYYQGRKDVLALEIDPGAVEGEIRYELAPKRGELFPHLYGDLPVSAVRRAQALFLREDGAFVFAGDGGAE